MAAISATTVLDHRRKSLAAQEFEESLARKIVGQEEALGKVSAAYQIHLASLNASGRPIANLLFLGPTGSGKTRVVEAVAETLFGDPRALIKVDCAEFQHSHEIAKLIGSPPGYLGHRETHPVFTQEALSQWHTEKVRVSLVLFDEIEKASDALWQLLLGILDKATLTLGDNRRVDFSQSVIFMTSNLGAGEMSRLTEGGIGFTGAAPAARTPQEAESLEQRIRRTAVEAARRRFSPEFLNRIDQIVVFRALTTEHLRKILDLELEQVQQRVLAVGHDRFLFHLSERAKEFLLAEGVDRRYGARHLKRAIERHLVQPLANLVASGQVRQGDCIAVDLTANGEMCFRRDAEGLPITAVDPLQPAPLATGAIITAAGRRQVAGRQ